jgi:hypothetical protein
MATRRSHLDEMDSVMDRLFRDMWHDRQSGVGLGSDGEGWMARSGIQVQIETSDDGSVARADLPGPDRVRLPAREVLLKEVGATCRSGVREVHVPVAGIMHEVGGHRIDIDRRSPVSLHSRTAVRERSAELVFNICCDSSGMLDSILSTYGLERIPSPSARDCALPVDTACIGSAGRPSPLITSEAQGHGNVYV